MKMILSVTTPREQQNRNIPLYLIQVSNSFSSTNVSLVNIKVASVTEINHTYHKTSNDQTIFTKRL